MDEDLEVLHHHNRDHSDGEQRRSVEEIRVLKQQDDIAVTKKDGPLSEAMNKLSVGGLPAK